jgi:hypothetical protein
LLAPEWVKPESPGWCANRHRVPRSGRSRRPSVPPIPGLREQPRRCLYPRCRRTSRHAGCSTPDVPRRMFHGDVPRRMFHAGCSTPDVPRRMFHGGCSTADVPRRMFHGGCSTPDVPRRMFHEETKRNQPRAKREAGCCVYQAAVGGLRHLSPDDYSRERERGCLDGFTTRISPSDVSKYIPLERR